jgi:hypothetical protein
MLGNFWLKMASPWGTAVVLKGFWASPQVLQRMVAGALAPAGWPSAPPGPPAAGPAQAEARMAARPEAAPATKARLVRPARARSIIVSFLRGRSLV